MIFNQNLAISPGHSTLPYPVACSYLYITVYVICTIPGVFSVGQMTEKVVPIERSAMSTVEKWNKDFAKKAKAQEKRRRKLERRQQS